MQVKTGVNSELAVDSIIRNSNIELYRIIVMLLIIAHHYVVNSGLMNYINAAPFSSSSVFLLLFGMWGKTGINCFVLVTGYFMCTSKISLKKFLKLLLQIEFYNLVIYLIFLAFGYMDFDINIFIKTLFPIKSVTDGFTSCFLLFYLCIPFLNILIKSLNKSLHRYLLLLSLGIYTLLGTTYIIPISMNYVTWFCVLFFIGSYIRLYEEDFVNFGNRGGYVILSIILSCMSVVAIAWFASYLQKPLPYYYMISDSNHILAVFTSVCMFLYFKNLNVKYHKWINTIATTTFGIFLIHTNGDFMRQWLWKDVLNNVGMYDHDLMVIHAVASVIVIFVICAVIDHFRIKWLEDPLFNYLNKKNCLVNITKVVKESKIILKVC